MIRYKSFPLSNNYTEDTKNYFIKEERKVLAGLDIILSYKNGKLDNVLYVTNVPSFLEIQNFHKVNYNNCSFSIYQILNSDKSFIIFNYSLNYALQNINIKEFNNIGLEIYDTLINENGELIEYNKIEYKNNQLNKVKSFYAKDAWIIDEQIYNE